ncbi:TlpA disulfide reductase family protein [uncultured Cohaesibacter sp.]|uniref:TlpA family protein disulfide reductase n=1 Tax=uncultured Cohaesibacter sp. TaxID=1002546 RepID=UPI0029C67786|nr:TlpA disulfide reductase family protein [uncultured Cohaesibacter sp.]
MVLNRVAAMLLLSLLTLAGCKDEDPVRAGAPAPDISAMSSDENIVDLSAYRGKVVFVNFWWAGCGPCLAEMPAIDEAYQEIGPSDLAVFSVNFGQEPQIVRNIARRLKVSYPLLSDQLKIAAARYGVRAAPTSFLIDREGILQEAIYGPLTKEQLQQKVERLL